MYAAHLALENGLNEAIYAKIWNVSLEPELGLI